MVLVMSETVVCCELCGKPLIKRKPNGLWHFVFGRCVDGDRPAVDMVIHGNVRLRCWRSGCGCWNTLNFLPKDGK